jgi:hypothetical protein
MHMQHAKHRQRATVACSGLQCVPLCRARELAAPSVHEPAIATGAARAASRMCTCRATRRSWTCCWSGGRTSTACRYCFESSSGSLRRGARRRSAPQLPRAPAGVLAERRGGEGPVRERAGGGGLLRGGAAADERLDGCAARCAAPRLCERGREGGGAPLHPGEQPAMKSALLRVLTKHTACKSGL